MEGSKTEESSAVISPLTSPVTVTAEGEQMMEKVSEVTFTKASTDDLPPPLPASPPPSEPVTVQAKDSVEVTTPPMEAKSLSENLEVTTSVVTRTITEKFETTEEIIKSAEEMVLETGQRIEEKATDILKTVEKRAEESMKTAGELVMEKVEDAVNFVENNLKSEGVVDSEVDKEVMKEGEVGDKIEEAANTIPVDVSDLEKIGTKTEETVEKVKATIPKVVPVDIACVEMKSQSKDMCDI